MKKIVITLFILAIFLTGIAVFRDLILRSVIISTASRITGTKVYIDGFSLNTWNSTIKINGFRMANPVGFPEGLLVSCPQIKVIYDPATLFRQQRHFLLVEIELKEMGLTKNKAGKLNVDSLNIVQRSGAAPAIPMQIDLLTLSIGRVVYKDYTAGAEPNVSVYNINVQKSYKQIPSAQQLILLALAEPMRSGAIKNAEIYGIAALAGVAVLPVGVAATFMGKDYVRQDIDATLERVYESSLVVLKRMGRVTKENRTTGVIKADIKGSMVALMLRKRPENMTEITISARKYIFPRLDIAGGVLYQVLDKLHPAL